MRGVVTELQKACLDSSVKTSEILQKAYVVARKLGLKEFEGWVSKELNGYGASEETPEYRSITGEVKVWNPYRGWIPVVLEDPRAQALINSRPTSQSVGQLEEVVHNARKNDNRLMMTFPPEQERMILGPNSLFANPRLYVPTSAVHGIVERVRQAILEWSLDLEEKGIVGEGMTFSEEEKKAAGSAQNIQVHYHGNVSQSQIATDRSSQSLNLGGNLADMQTFVVELRQHIEKLKLTSDQQAQVLADLSTIESQLLAPRPSTGIVGEAYKSVRNIIEGTVGSLLASGILTKLPPLW